MTILGGILGHLFTLRSQRYAKYFESRLKFAGLLALLAEKYRFYAKVNDQSHGQPGQTLFFRKSAIDIFSDNATLRDELDRSFWLCYVSLTKHKQKKVSKLWRDIRHQLNCGADASDAMGQQDKMKECFEDIGPKIENLCSEFNVAIR